MGGNLASMHMRNLECAIVVFAKLRGVFVETSGVFCCVGVVCALVALSVSSSLSFRHSCILRTFVVAKELKQGCYLRYVYIFRFGVGVVAV